MAEIATDLFLRPDVIHHARISSVVPSITSRLGVWREVIPALLKYYAPGRLAQHIKQYNQAAIERAFLFQHR